MAHRGSVEVERKYDVDSVVAVPALTELPGVERIGPADSRDLEALYFDTDDLALAAHGITLRRRTGGPDAGWHLKLPLGPDARDEIAEALGTGGDEVPHRLQQLVRAHVRDRALKPVARIATKRQSLDLYGEDESLLAEFSDDRVESEALVGDLRRSAWREWEIELSGAPDDLLAAATDLLAGAGAKASAHASKLARALGDSDPPAAPERPKPKRKGPASAVLLDYLHRQTDRLKAMDRAVREDEPDGVHQLRVSARRMRSALASYRKLLDRATADQLRDELQWAANAVGEARDIEVMRQRLADLVAAEPAEFVLGPVAQRIEEELGARYRDARASGVAALNDPRYFRLLDSLDAFLAEPPLTPKAERKARKATARLVKRDLAKFRAAVHAAQDAEGPDAVDPALHEARKKAKRLRYAAEAAMAVHGKRAKRLAKDAAQIQQTLGDHQDSVVTREMLRELATTTALEGTNAFTLGRLHAEEERRGAEDQAEFFGQWKGFRPKRLR